MGCGKRGLSDARDGWSKRSSSSRKMDRIKFGINDNEASKDFLGRQGLRGGEIFALFHSTRFVEARHIYFTANYFVS